MIKKITIFTILLICIFMFSFAIQSVNALPVYVGVKILNMTDEAGSSCANAAGGDYGWRGRIRAISSILPWHPIYFNLTNQSNGATIWAGNSTDNTDYAIGDIMYLPNTIDLVSGTSYNLFFDIDAIRIYLPLVDSDSFIATLNDEYWTAGKVGTGSTAENSQFSLYAASTVCTYAITYTNQLPSNTRFISNNRGNLIHTCMSDATPNNCDNFGYMGNYAFGTSGGNWNINSKYNDLHLPTVGNFNIVFTMP